MAEDKPLYAGLAYPIEFARSFNFAQGSATVIKSSNPLRPSFTFGIDRDRTAAQLRALADLIQEGYVAMQDITEVTRAQGDEFTMTWLSLQFAMRLAPEKT